MLYGKKFTMKHYLNGIPYIHPTEYQIQQSLLNQKVSNTFKKNKNHFKNFK